MDYYVGIDGGGTRTAAAVANEDQEVVFRCYAKTINFCGVDFETAKLNMKELFDTLKEKLGVTQFSKVIIGSSSNYDSDELDLLNNLNSVIPSESIAYHSDADVALQCIDEDTGAIIISGTGSMLLAKVKEKRYTVGGYGHILGDEGSAYDIAIKGIQQALRSYDGWAQPTALLQKMKEYFELDCVDNIINKVYIDNSEKAYIAGFSMTVSQAADEGDNVACAILKDAAENLFRQYTALQNKCGTRLDAVYLYGSVLIHDKIVASTFREMMQKEYPTIAIKNLTRPPEIGALRFCFEEYKNDLAR